MPQVQNTRIAKYSADELKYVMVKSQANGRYLIDAYKDDRLLMTYDAYYDYRSDEFKLYPKVPHRLDSRTPGYHKVMNRKVENKRCI